MNKLVFVTLLLASAGVVHAEPADGGAEKPASPPQAYVSAGVEGGADSAVDWVYGGTSLEGGYHLRGAWWLHGEAGMLGRMGWGTTNDLTLMRPKEYGYDGRLGVEARGCKRESLCYYGGGDIGYRTGTARGNDISGAMVDLRGGLDFGVGGGVRFRPGVEMLLSNAPNLEREIPLPMVALGVTAALAYVW